MVYHYTIPDIPPSNNESIGRNNRWGYQDDKKKWANLISAYCRPKPEFPIEHAVVTLKYHFKDKRRRDLDNYSGKFIFDGLTAAEIIKDDNCHIIFELRLTAVFDGQNSTEIFIEEV